MSFGLARVAPEKTAFRPVLPVSFMPGVNGTHMTKMTYQEQLQHPNWQRRRLEVLNLYGFECGNCGDKEKMLHVHHKKYVKGRMAWEYSDEELEVLCKDCHADEHENKALLERLIENMSGGLPYAIGLLAGYMDVSMDVANEEDERRAKALGGPTYVSGQIAGLLECADWPTVGKFAESVRKHPNPAEEQFIKWLKEF